MERDLSYYHLLCVIGIFQLTRSRGAWHALDRCGRGIENFNSHAHVERDILSCDPTTVNDISTHTLTWSVTFFLVLLVDLNDISTHTLTWSVTQREKALPFMINISTHTLTWSVTHPLKLEAFLLLFQLTRSRGAWQVFDLLSRVQPYFNSHAHVERDIIGELLRHRN